MDQSVIDALQRWPNVPAVYGWLSLSARGDWRLHPLGDAQLGKAGEGISNPQILGFMGRNYACEPDGKWFFQNGPQRVYVRLDAAPYAVHIHPQTATLVTHNGLSIEQVLGWFTDELGQLYAQTNLGGARIDDRDLIALAEVLQTPEGMNLLDALDAGSQTAGNQLPYLFDPTGHYPALSTPVACQRVLNQELPHKLGFVKNPQSATSPQQVF